DGPRVVGVGAPPTLEENAGHPFASTKRLGRRAWRLARARRSRAAHNPAAYNTTPIPKAAAKAPTVGPNTTDDTSWGTANAKTGRATAIPTLELKGVMPSALRTCT